MTTEHNRPRYRLLASSLIFCALLTVVLGVTNAILKPARSLLKGEAGAAWGGYQQQKRDSVDVVFFGNSHVFDAVNPAELWRRRGVTSYVLAGPTQQLEVTKYYVREAFRTQKPKVVAVDLSSAAYDRSRIVPEFQQINVGYMPWSVNKLGAGLLATPAGQRVGVLVDLWIYHSRWLQLTPADWNFPAKNRDDAYMKGWAPATRSRPVSSTPTLPLAAKDATDTQLVDYNIVQLRDIAKICKQHNAMLLLFLTPTGPPNTYTRLLDRARQPLTSEFDNVKTLDLSAPGAVPGLSYKDDFFDPGHLQYQGADKASDVLADYVATTYGVVDHRSDPAYASWQADMLKSDERIKSLLKK